MDVVAGQHDHHVLGSRLGLDWKAASQVGMPHLIHGNDLGVGDGSLGGAVDGRRMEVIVGL